MERESRHGQQEEHYRQAGRGRCSDQGYTEPMRSPTAAAALRMPGWSSTKSKPRPFHSDGDLFVADEVTYRGEKIERNRQQSDGYISDEHGIPPFADVMSIADPDDSTACDVVLDCLEHEIRDIRPRNFEATRRQMAFLRAIPPREGLVRELRRPNH